MGTMLLLLAAALFGLQDEPKGERFDLKAGKLFLPESFKRGDAADLLVHFHGLPRVVEREFARAGKNAALVTVNAGTGSAVYAKAMQEAGALDALLDEALSKIPGAKRGRVFLSSFSAGYGAVREILKHGKVEVSWIHLADSLHAGYEEGKPRADQMAPFVAYAKSGKPLWITHSAIVPGDYASTTETADALLAALGAVRAKADEKNPRGMRLSSTSDKGEVHVRGYEGTTAPAHVEHLQNLGEYFSKLP